ncbi:hypothetical protein [Nocardiopsis suaedae]|uniref:Extracellular solute-binding protein n=1 Tax=Nocardiopsis suaedae TaxID=3018444 RepID=A0ABT4TPP1_9ACTN|nr:hypothetical protein [Nocardiopsis suaedae]MDA2806648.1 hypothetical protein [Nocardiopsis suaedae]
MRRITALVVSGLLVAGVLAAVVWNLAGPEPRRVTGVIGSEKAPFFADPDVVARLADLGYEVEVRTRGSRSIARSDLDGADFGFPGSDPSAEAFQREHGTEREYRPFYSPMVVLSHRPVAEALRGAGVASEEDDGTWTIDMAAFLDLTGDRARWRDLPGGGYGGAGRSEVLIRTTDPRTSNSAAMYLAVVAYLLNGEQVPQEPLDGGDAERIARLYLAQGAPPESSKQPFDQYAALGAGHTPLLWAYEAQYAGTRGSGTGLPDGAVVMYPAPTTVSNHTLLPLTDAGDAVGRLLTEDPELQRLAAEHGFRTADADLFAAAAEEADRPVRAQVADVVNAPAYEVVEGMLSGLEDAYADGGMPAPAEEASDTGGTDGGDPDADDADGGNPRDGAAPVRPPGAPPSRPAQTTESA